MNETPNDTTNQDNLPAENETKTEEKSEHATHPRKRAHKRQTGGHVIVWLLLIAIVLAGGGALYAVQYLNQSRDVLLAQINELEQQQQTLRDDSRQYQQSANAQLLAIQKNQEGLTNYIDVLRTRDKHLRKDWLVLEAEYLIQLANYRLQFERDINTAMVALQSADVRLKDTGDPALLNVRKAIAASIQALKQIEQVDVAGLSLTLTALNQELGKLPLNTPDPVAKAKAANTELAEAKQVTSWTELPAAIWRDIKNLIVIRDHEQPVGPLLSPEQRFFLVENLHLQIEQARLALLAGQVSVYQERLATAKQWIESHFNTEAPITKGTLETLGQLQSANIAPTLPDISASYQALQKFRANNVPDVKPANESTSDGSK